MATRNTNPRNRCPRPSAAGSTPCAPASAATSGWRAWRRRPFGWASGSGRAWRIDWIFEPPRLVREVILAAGGHRPGRGAVHLHSSPGLCPPQRQQHGHGARTPLPGVQRQPADDGRAEPADRPKQAGFNPSMLASTGRRAEAQDGLRARGRSLRPHAVGAEADRRLGTGGRDRPARLAAPGRA